MDVREKLVELLGNIYLPIMAGPDVIGEYRIPHKLKEEIADHLINNGVTVQEYAYLETVVEVKDNTVCRSRVPNEVSQLTKKIVGLKNV